MEIRLENLVWTIAENYDFEVDLNYFYDNFRSKYKAALLGYFFKKYNMNYVGKFLNEVAKPKSNRNDLLYIAELAMENALTDDLLKDRPGVLDNKKEYIKDILYKYDISEPKCIRDELEKAYYQNEKNIPVKINGSLYELFKEIKNFKSQDTAEIIEFLDEIYKKYFHIYSSLPETESIKKIIKNAREDKDNNKKQKYKKDNTNSIEVANLEKFTIESAEFTSSEYNDLKVVMDKGQSMSSKDLDLFEKLRKHYGECTMNYFDRTNLENEVCTGIHSGIKLFFTKGEYKQKDSLYYKHEAELSHEKNLEKYQENELLYRRGIKNLEEIIKNSLLRNTEEYEILSHSGSLVASKVWKSVKGIDDKIFMKNSKENQGSISVDIILDQSASQKTRQSEVAIEGYIIAEALTNLNIKTRVLGFNNFYNYMVIREYRNYNDSKLKNQEIFKYHASGSNRDGLVIKLLNHLISKNSEERKLMIVLSDGKPNDEINLGLVGTRNLNAEDYVDEAAILDSFNQVLVARLNGINVLGVFMGEEEDLEAEKKIFGQNFAYITDITRFHHIVGIFFKAISKEYFE